MAWLLGKEDSVEVISSVGLDDLLKKVSGDGCLYAGYLLTELVLDSFESAGLHQRILLNLRAGWSSVAFTARSQQDEVRAALRDYAPPTSPGPRHWAPKGLYILEKTRLAESLRELPSEGEFDLANSLHQKQLERGHFFCDPILEFELQDLDAGQVQELKQGGDSLACRLIRLGSAFL